MIPERYDALVARGARYGYSRIVLGVHYPLDVIGSRMVAERNVAHYLNDPHYRVLFNEARDQLRAALAKACGTSLAECAKSSVKDDPRRDPAMRDFSLHHDLRSAAAEGSAAAFTGAGGGGSAAGRCPAASVSGPASNVDGQHRAA